MRRKCLLALTALFAVITSAAAQEYQIKFVRPAKVGDQFRLVASGSNAISKIVTVAEKKMPPEATSYAVQFEGVGTVKQISASGEPMEVSFQVTKCIKTVDGTNTELAPKDAVLVAKSVNGHMQYAIGNKMLARDIGEALSLMLDLGSGSNDDDQIFGTNQPQKVGDSWPINAELAARKLKSEGIDVPPSAIDGKVTLLGLKSHDGIPCLEIRSNLAVHGAVPDLGEVPPGVKLNRAIMKGEISGLLPQDAAMQLPVQSMKMELEAELIATRPDGTTMSIVQSGKRTGKREITAIKPERKTP